MGEIFLYLLSGILPKLLPFKNSVVLLYASEEIHCIEELHRPTNCLFTYDMVLIPMQQNGTERHRKVAFCYSMADKPIRQEVILNEPHRDRCYNVAKNQ